MDRKELRIKMGLFAEEVMARVEFDKCYGNYALGEELRRAGYRVLGAGGYGTVIKHPEFDMVLKICIDEFDGYPAFARWAEVNRPAHVVDIIYTCRVNESLFFAAMPVYASVEQGTQEARMIDNINCNVPRGAYELEVRDALDWVFDVLGDYACRDTHSGNWMLDSDGNLLISDPLAGISTYRTTTAEAEAVAIGMQYKSYPTQQLDLCWVDEVPTLDDFDYWDEASQLDAIKPRPTQPMQLQKVGEYGFQCGR